jgi:hypothetical protein
MMDDGSLKLEDESDASFQLAVGREKTDVIC